MIRLLLHFSDADATLVHYVLRPRSVVSGANEYSGSGDKLVAQRRDPHQLGYPLSFSSLVLKPRHQAFP